MRKIIIILGVLLLSINLTAQATAEVKFTKKYMTQLKPSGYLIHSHSGELIDYKIFSYKEREEECLIHINKDSISHRAITVFDSNIGSWIFSIYALYDGLTMNYPYYEPFHSLDNFASYQTDFSKYKEINQISKVLMHHPKKLWDGNHLSYKYDVKLPILIPFQKSDNPDEIFFITLQNNFIKDRVRITDDKVKSKNVFSTRSFTEFPLTSKEKWNCKILLYSTESELPYLMYKNVSEQTHAAVPVPEKLKLNKIGFISGNRNGVHYRSKYSPFVSSDTSTLVPNPDIDKSVQVTEGSIFIDVKDISYFKLQLQYEWDDSSERNHYWTISGWVNGKTILKLPVFPSELIKKKPILKKYTAPTKGKLELTYKPNNNPIKNEELVLLQLEEFNWCLENNISIYKYYFDWQR